MTRTITQRELRNDSAAVLRAVQAGETVTVTRHGTPVAELRPIGRARMVPRDVILRGREAEPRIDAARFRADLDSVLDQTIDD
ncbi:MAG: type II toxin-antitoxin system Phd/YefM family antitoxin [Acidimicrobiales bacterium]